MNNVERQCWANAHCSRRECLNIIGISSSFNINDLEHRVCRVFNRIGVDVKPDDIEACHRLYNVKKTIVKFSKQKLCQQVLQVKKDLKNIDISKFDFAKGTVIFFNGSLCSYYTLLLDKGKWKCSYSYTYYGF